MNRVVIISILIIILGIVSGCTKQSDVPKNNLDNQEMDDAQDSDMNNVTDDNGMDINEKNEDEKSLDEFKPITEGENHMDTGVIWEEEEVVVYQPKQGGVWYPRMYQLKNGTILCGFDTNEDGGRAVIKIVTSKDGGNTWNNTAVQATELPELNCANANFIELENGDIWVAYRANEWEGDVYYSSIRVNVSTDGGQTWAPHSVVAEEKGEGGVYEPHFGYIGDKIAVFYANDSLNVVKNNRQQNIEFKLWENGNWSDKIIASDGTKTFSRDGMPIWCQMEDGSYGLVIESTSLSPSAIFIIQMKTSPDGLDWSEKLRNVYIPKGKGKKAGAPYIEKLQDGRVAISFHTDEDATENGDGYSKMKVIISTDASATQFLPASVPFDTPDGYNSTWNAMLSYHDYLLAVTSTNYPSSSILLKRGKVQ